MMPGSQGPQYSTCANRKTINVDAGEVIEDRNADQIKGNQIMLTFRKGPMNIMTAFAY